MRRYNAGPQPGGRPCTPTTTGQVPALPPPLPPPCRPRVSPTPLKPSLVRHEQYGSSHSPGMVGAGGLGEPGQSHNLESCCCRMVVFGVACVPYLACPASLCHAMPVGVRDESSSMAQMLCDMTVAEHAG